jgi:hypothetical protein
MERKPRWFLFFLMGHVLAAASTWRDIERQPPSRIRGGKALWRALSAVNTLGTAGYWLIGRRYRSSDSG